MWVRATGVFPSPAPRSILNCFPPARSLQPSLVSCGYKAIGPVSMICRPGARRPVYGTLGDRSDTPAGDAVLVPAFRLLARATVAATEDAA